MTPAEAFAWMKENLTDHYGVLRLAEAAWAEITKWDQKHGRDRMGYDECDDTDAALASFLAAVERSVKP